MSTDHFIVAGLPISTLSVRETAERICRNAGSKASSCVFTLNLDHVVKLRKDPAFRQAYARANLITADGFPIVLAGRLQGKRLQRVAGSDLIDPLCSEAARSGKSIFLLGSTFDVLALAARRLLRDHPGLEIAGALAPPQGFDPTGAAAIACVDLIRASAAAICLIALGAPKQEIFADHAAGKLPSVAFVCIGAGLDFLAGAQTRAPAWMQRCGLEWLWRLAGDPRRLLGRYLLCLGVVPHLVARSLVIRQAG